MHLSQDRTLWKYSTPGRPLRYGLERDKREDLHIFVVLDDYSGHYHGSGSRVEDSNDGTSR